MVTPDAMWAFVPQALAALGSFVFGCLGGALGMALGIRYLRQGALT